MFRLVIPATFVVAALVAACSGTAATPAPTTSPATPAATVAVTPAPTLAFTVALAPDGFFVGPDGKTLYSFDKDTTPGESSCTSGQCADNWPPLKLADGAKLAIGAGLPESDFSTIKWADGTNQVTFKGVPLYYFAGDQAVGDKNGDGIGGVWHLATKATVPVVATTPEPTVAPATAPATTGPATSVPSPASSPEGCFDADGYQTPCPSEGAATVSLSTEGNLVSATGFSLYTFDNDTTENSSACTADCLTNWPALTIEDGSAVSVGEGLDVEDFSTFTRADDGTFQVTYYGKPLYMFAGDAAAGDINGDGVGGVWHLAKPPVVASLSDEGNLVNAAGFSLYTFDNDTTENQSACTGDCLTNWPALTIEEGSEVTLGEGLDAEDFTTFTRADDQTLQVAYYGKPLYMFAGDAAAGDTNGDGVGGVWHLAKPPAE